MSPLFVSAAQASFGGSAAMHYAALDIERDPRAQGFEPGGYDIVFAANVVHATRDVATSLTHLRSLLAPGGLLVLQEITRGPRWLDLVFGITDGWWAFDDRALRPARAILDVDTWHRALAMAGFEEPAHICEHEDPIPGQSVLVARAPTAIGRLMPTHGWCWRIAAARVSALPRGCDAPDTAPRRYLRDGRPMPTVLGDVERELGAIHGVLHCWSLDLPGADAATPSASIMQAQAQTCGTLVELLQACQSAGRVPRVVLVTGGAQPISATGEVTTVAQAPLWGLGRVLLLEQPSTAPLLIDCSAAPTPDELDGVIAETLSGAGENEVALRGSARYVRRVARLDTARAASRSDGRRAGERTPLPGDRRQQWIARRRGAARTDGARADARRNRNRGQGRVAQLPRRDVHDGHAARGGVRQHAERGRAGRRLRRRDQPRRQRGHRRRTGDEVMALSPASLASHAITKDLVARKPAGLSFADAAALPLAYVTAIYALERIARLERGERVLIHAATGGVGLAALAVAERAGAEIFATAGTEAKRAYLRARGIRHVMDSRTLDFAGQIMSATGGRGVDVVLNSLAGEAIRAGLSVLAPRGRFLEIGKADIYRRGDLPLDAFRNNISFAAIQIDVLSDSNRPLLRDLLREVTRGIEDGTLPPLPQQTVPVGSLGRRAAHAGPGAPHRQGGHRPRRRDRADRVVRRTAAALPQPMRRI